MKRPLALFLLASLGASTALATTYMRVEKDGTKTYSDRPIPGGVPINLEPAQGYSAPPVNSPSSSSNSPDAIDAFTYQTCSVSPENDASFFNPESVSISVNTSPALRPFDSVTLSVDGQVVQPPGSTSTSMSPVERGTHTVSVTIRNRDGRIMCSVTSSFHVQRPSVNSPARAPAAPNRPNRPRPTPH